jgi:hypothetical protein
LKKEKFGKAKGSGQFLAGFGSVGLILRRLLKRSIISGFALLVVS